LLFCDADDEVAAGWLEAMGIALVDHAFVACRFDVRKLNPPWLLSGRGNPQDKGLERLAYPPFTLYAAGGTLGVRRSTHDMVGGFDVAMRYLEDTDYCLRIQRRGIPLQFVPEAVVHYRFPLKPRAIYRQAFRWAQYNVLLYKRSCRTHWGDWPLWRGYLGAWVRLAKAAACRPSMSRRAVLAERLGTQMGALKGAVLYRIPPVIL
jgi:GT2 family glycosyltransferase